MIVEIFGPAGAGKTTFAHALRARLNARGHSARVVLSYQPAAEVSHLDPGGALVAIRRIVRAVIGTVVIAVRPIAKKSQLRMTLELVRALPPSNVIWLVRLTQYVLRLCDCWNLSSGAADIIIFDQAFVQAICTLALNSSATNDARLAKAIGLIPKADLIVRLEAPDGMLASRLRHRRRRQAFVERLFEAEIAKNVAGARIVDRVDVLLEGQGIPRISLDLHDRSSLNKGLDRVEAVIARTQIIKRGGLARSTHDRAHKSVAARRLRRADQKDRSSHHERNDGTGTPKPL